MAQDETNEILTTANNLFFNYFNHRMTSDASPPNRRRRNDIELHPLTQLRLFRPPLNDNEFDYELQSSSFLEENLDDSLQDINSNQEILSNIENHQSEYNENDYNFINSNDFVLDTSDDFNSSFSGINESGIYEVIFYLKYYLFYIKFLG